MGCCRRKPFKRKYFRISCSSRSGTGQKATEEVQYDVWVVKAENVEERHTKYVPLHVTSTERNSRTLKKKNRIAVFSRLEIESLESTKKFSAELSCEHLA